VSSLSKLKKKACAEYKKGKKIQAKKLLTQVCDRDISDTETRLMLADLYIKSAEYHQAYKLLSSSLQYAQHNMHAMTVLGEICIVLKNFSEALNYLNLVIKNQPENAHAYFLLGEASRNQSAFDSAEHYYERAINFRYTKSHVHYYRGLMQNIQGRAEDAAKSFKIAYDLDSSLVKALWAKERVLPVIFNDSNEIKVARQRYSDGIDSLKKSISLSTPKERQEACDGLASSTNFYLQYQGCDDLELQLDFGELLINVMSATFPKYVDNIQKHYDKTRKIKVGYVSPFLRNHNGAVWLLGWLRARDTADIEVYCYHTSDQKDDKTSLFEQYSDHFCTISDSIQSVAEKIYSDKLDILVHPELGMSPESMMLAGLRLAPVQCVGWGHPVSTGLKTIDYWLSSDLMEPENADEHYCENLVRLPNLANNYSKDQHIRIHNELFGKKSRADFGLPEANVLYFCSQSLFKYLPEYDHLWPEIALKCSDAKFVFLAISSVYVIKKFMARIQLAFNKYGLKAEDYCIMLNRQTPDDYLVLNELVDVFLDNPPWSGNNTSMAAIDAYLPIVTYPTEFMRGRHSYAILKMLDITETIASSESEYVDIAVRLGTDESYLKEIKDKIIANHDLIYNDSSCVRYLESFYRDVVSS